MNYSLFVYIWTPKCQNSGINFVMNFLNNGHSLNEENVFLYLFEEYAIVIQYGKLKARYKPA